MRGLSAGIFFLAGCASGASTAGRGVDAAPDPSGSAHGEDDRDAGADAESRDVASTPTPPPSPAKAHVGDACSSTADCYALWDSADASHVVGGCGTPDTVMSGRCTFDCWQWVGSKAQDDPEKVAACAARGGECVSQRAGEDSPYTMCVPK